MKAKSISIWAILAGLTLTFSIGALSIQYQQQVWAPRDCPSCTPFNFKVKECRVDTNPEPVSCKELRAAVEHAFTSYKFVLATGSSGGDLVITLTPAEPER